MKEGGLCPRFRTSSCCGGHLHRRHAVTFICRGSSALARRSVIVRARAFFAAISLALAATIPVARAQPLLPSPAEPGSQTAFGALPGRWVRPDGGYVIGINAIDDNGKLDASYANPRPLPFYTAVVIRDVSSSVTCASAVKRSEFRATFQPVCPFYMSSDEAMQYASITEGTHRNHPATERNRPEANVASDFKTRCGDLRVH
jgi:hypothetical protein